jgi:hypothetical protein
MIDNSVVREYLRTTDASLLYHREGQELEYKEQFNFAGLADYFRDFAAFANNKGGYIIFGVSDAPRRQLVGLTDASFEQFDRIDPERITGFLLNIYSGNISWEKSTISFNEKHFGVFKINEAIVKPVIAKKDEGRDSLIKNGDIYFRYGGRTQKIAYAELEAIINQRIEHINRQWIDLMSKIGKVGAQNAAIYDTENSILEKDDSKILVIDEETAEKIKFIKEGEFDEKKGAPTLKLVGRITTIDKVEVTKKIKENLIRTYPLSAMELNKEIKKRIPGVNQDDIYRVIRETDMKNNIEYSAYNFRSLRHEEIFKFTGKIPTGTPSLYKLKAVDFIVKILQNEK